VPIFLDLKRNLFPYGSQDTLATITGLGYVLLLFETGVKMDFTLIRRTGIKGWTISLLGLVTPMLIGFCFFDWDPIHIHVSNEEYTERGIILVGHNTTSFAVIVSLLKDLKLLNSELGRLALSVALVGEILSNIFITVTATLLDPDHYISPVLRLGCLFAITVFILLIYRPAMFWIVEHTPEGKEVKDIYVNVVIGTLFCLCWLSGELEKGPVFLPFILGLATPEGPPLGSTLIKRVHLLGIKLFLPINMTTSTMKVEYGFWRSSYSGSTLETALFVLFTGYFVKMLACFLSSLVFNMPLKDGISLALLLNCKGVVEVNKYCTALDRNVSTKISPLHHTHFLAKKI